MAKKNQKIIKSLKKIAEDIDNISLNDPEGLSAVKHKFRYMRPATYQK